MRIRALVAAAAVALIVPAVPAFATTEPTPDPTSTATVDPTADPGPTDPADPTDPTDPASTETSEPTGDPTPTDTPTVDPEPAPTLSVRSTVSGAGVMRAGNAFLIEVEVDQSPSAAVELSWQWWDYYDHVTLGEQSEPVATTLDGMGRTSLALQAPSSLPDGVYSVKVTVKRVSDGALGTGGGHSFFTLDNTAPAFLWTRSASGFYPATDGYRDRFSVWIYGVDERVIYAPHTPRYNVQVLRQDGTVLRTMGSGQLDWSGREGVEYERTVYWNGLDASGGRVPAGTYRIKATVTDGVGNSTTKMTTVAVSWKKLTWKTYYKKVTAADALDYKYVGSCSALKAPARSDWAESRGFRSNVKCRGGDTAKSRVVTDSVTCLPRSFDGNYRNLTMKHYGGRPKGYTKNVYLVTHVYRPQTSGDWTLAQRHQFGNSVQWKTMASVSTPNGLIADRKSTKYCPSIWWVSGLQSSSRYDVWKYSVGIQYRVLA